MGRRGAAHPLAFRFAGSQQQRLAGILGVGGISHGVANPHQSCNRAVPAGPADAGGLGGRRHSSGLAADLPGVHDRLRTPPGGGHPRRNRSRERAAPRHRRPASQVEHHAAQARERRGAGAQPVPQHPDRSQGHQLDQDFRGPRKSDAVQRPPGFGAPPRGGFEQSGPARHGGGRQRRPAYSRSVETSRRRARSSGPTACRPPRRLRKPIPSIAITSR